MKLRWSPRAIDDLLEIGARIRRDNPGAARRWVERLRTRARLAAAHPLAGRRVPESTCDDLREIVEGNYRIVYRLRPEAVEVLLVFEAHRMFPEVDLLHEP